MVLFLLTLLKTHTLSAVIGIIVVYIISAIAGICSKKTKTPAFIISMVSFIIGMIFYLLLPIHLLQLLPFF